MSDKKRWIKNRQIDKNGHKKQHRLTKKRDEQK